MKSWHLWLGFGLSVLGLLYCFFAVLMAGSLAAGPNYSKARLEYNVHIWTTGTFFSPLLYSRSAL